MNASERAQTTLLRILGRSIDVLLIGMIAFGALALGGAWAWAPLVIEMAAAALLVAWLAHQLLLGRLRLVPTPVYLLLLAPGLIALLQLAPLPHALVGWLSPNVGVLSGELDAGGLNGPLPLTARGDATADEAMLWLAYAAIFFVAVNHVSASRDARRFLYAIVGLAGGVAIAALICSRISPGQDLWSLLSGRPRDEAVSGTPAVRLQSGGFAEMAMSKPLLGPDRVAWFHPVYHRSIGGGTFADREQLALFLAISIPLGLGLVLTLLQRVGRRMAEGSLINSSDGTLCLLLAVVVGFAGWALVETGSITALLATGFGICCFAGLVALVSYRKLPMAAALAFTGAAVLAGCLVLGPMTSEVWPSLSRDVTTDRAGVWATTWRIIQEFPLVGSGAGTFADVYARYHDGAILAQFAHNDYLQWLSEMGILGGLVLVAALVHAVRLLITFLRRPPANSICFALAGVWGGAAAVALAAVAEYPMRVPAIAIVCVVLLSLMERAVRVPLVRRHAVSRNTAQHAPQPTPDLVEVGT